MPFVGFTGPSMVFLAGGMKGWALMALFFLDLLMYNLLPFLYFLVYIPLTVEESFLCGHMQLLRATPCVLPLAAGSFLMVLFLPA